MKGVMTRSLVIVMILAMAFSLYGCSKDNEVIEDTGIIDGENIEEAGINNEEETTKDVINDEELETEEEKEGIPSPISGLYGPEEKVNRRPIAVMFDNHPRARWQAGLSQAEVVYEFLVEYPYTRYMGIYVKNDPEDIGPVRSARPYFITTAMEYDAIYVHDGGSEAAKADIKKLGIADIDGQSSSSFVFWRYNDTGKKAPNNEYTNMERLRKTQEDRGYRTDYSYLGFKFNEEEMSLEGVQADIININYNPDNNTKYIYDKEERVYTRHKDGKLHVDELDGSVITAKNVIIQKAVTKSVDNVGRLDIELVGNGEGKYVTNGKAIDITWEKKSRKSKTMYYNANKEEITLNPGVTWIQVVKPNTKVTIE